MAVRNLQFIVSILGYIVRQPSALEQLFDRR